MQHTSCDLPISTVRVLLPVRFPWQSRSHSQLYLQIKCLETDVLVALATLRRRINPHESSVYRLHPELLSLMASHLATDDLVKATHVSYHWRTVLLSYPSLWTTLDFAHVGRTLTFLERSKSAPLLVFLQRIPPNIPLPLELLGQPAARITSLYINHYASQKEFLLRTASSLKTLQFYPRDTKDLFNETTRLSFPALKTLVIGDIDPLLFSVPHLTRFGFSTSRARKRRAVDGLFDFLRSCHLLEWLEVSHNNEFYTRRNHQVIHLPHLRAYTHYTSTDLYLGLYNMLSYPSSCSVTFFSDENSFGLEDALRPFHNPAPLVDVRRVKLKVTVMDEGDRVKGMAEMIDASRRRACSTRQVFLRAEVEAWETAVIDFVNPLYPGFLKGLNPRSIETLCVEDCALWFYEKCDRVEEALGHLEHIRTLILSDSAVSAYLSALAPTEATDTSGWQCLELDTIVIRSRHYLDESGDYIISTLCRVAQRRKEAGIPLRTVSLFLHRTPPPQHLEWKEVLEELRECIGTFKFVDDADALLDWNVDDYFLVDPTISEERLTRATVYTVC